MLTATLAASFSRSPGVHTSLRREEDQSVAAGRAPHGVPQRDQISDQVAFSHFFFFCERDFHLFIWLISNLHDKTKL